MPWSNSLRPLCFELAAASGEPALIAALPQLAPVQIQPGAGARIRIGLRLGALHVERAFSLVLREKSLRRDAPFLRLEFALPFIITTVETCEARRAA